jgi:hypothetical protein
MTFGVKKLIILDGLSYKRMYKLEDFLKFWKLLPPTYIVVLALPPWVAVTTLVKWLRVVPTKRRGECYLLCYFCKGILRYLVKI